MLEQIGKINALIQSLDEDTSLMLQAISVKKYYRKNEIILIAGSICKSSYWIEKGVVRKFHLHDEREITTEFYVKNDLAVSFKSYVMQKPSAEFLQALTDVELNAIDYERFQNAKIKYPALQQLDLLLTEYYAMYLEEKVIELHTQNATKRYLNLIEKSPEIIQQVMLTQIASYLNVSLETLSRIRAKI